jgi:ABC-type lipoprotein release transport system permease subunit
LASPASAAALLPVVALIASVIPARRAPRIQPLEALKLN